MQINHICGAYNVASNYEMNKRNKKNSRELTEHFFRNEYGKIVAVITKHIGNHNINAAEDIVQETLLKAVEYWQHNGIPENPTAWLYTTAKNKTLNHLKKNKIHLDYLLKIENHAIENIEIEFSDEIINDEQLRIMFCCCQPNISEDTQVSLILKFLCGFSITEISNAFLTSSETINKRLVRGRKELRQNSLNLKSIEFVNNNLDTLLKTIYLLFNEGYSPTQKEQITNNDLCLEAIRLTTILTNSSIIENKSNAYALLALMYLNIARFDARVDLDNSIVELEKQDRKLWNQEFINQGICFLNIAVENSKTSKYLILATISANYCIAKSYAETNWKEILELYDKLIQIENSPLIQLNKSVVLSKVSGSKKAIDELLILEQISEIGKNHLFHSTISEFYKNENRIDKAINSIKTAIKLSKNKRDIHLLEKKLNLLVPIS